MAGNCPICCSGIEGVSHSITPEIQEFYELDEQWVGKRVCYEHFSEYCEEMNILVGSSPPADTVNTAEPAATQELQVEIPPVETEKKVEEGSTHPTHSPISQASTQEISPKVDIQMGHEETHSLTTQTAPVDEKTSSAYEAIRGGEQKKLMELEKRRAESSLERLKKGALFIKYRYGKGQKRYVWLDVKTNQICWGKKYGKALNFGDVSTLTGITRWHEDEWGGFKRKGKKEVTGLPKKELCLSLLFQDRTLDLVCPGEREREQWYDALQYYINHKGMG